MQRFKAIREENALVGLQVTEVGSKRIRGTSRTQNKNTMSARESEKTNFRKKLRISSIYGQVYWTYSIHGQVYWTYWYIQGQLADGANIFLAQI